MSFTLAAQKRELQGSGASRRLRRASKVPAILYGGSDAPMAIELDHNAFYLALKKPDFASSVITLNVDGKAQTALLRDLQMHPFKRLVMHADFLRVDTTHAIQQKVPFRLLNADIAPGVKVAGGLVSHTMTEVMVACLPQDLPASITVDLKNLEAGKTIHLSQVAFPANVKPVLHPGEDPVVVSIVAKKAAKEETEEGSAASATTAS